jgi:hypothetical protein
MRVDYNECKGRKPSCYILVALSLTSGLRLAFRNAQDVLASCDVRCVLASCGVAASCAWRNVAAWRNASHKVLAPRAKPLFHCATAGLQPHTPLLQRDP